jgi:hypothetical protein
MRETKVKRGKSIELGVLGTMSRDRGYSRKIGIRE